MTIVRRWYTYLVSAISFQILTWAIINLCRILLAPGSPLAEALAFQMAILVIGLPIFLIHWIWAQRLVHQSFEERQSAIRQFYSICDGHFVSHTICGKCIRSGRNLDWLALATEPI